jgi:hypothetical protein
VYAVSWFNPHEISGQIFPNVFPDYDMAVDCVIYQIKATYDVELSELVVTRDMGGQKIIEFEQHVFMIGKLFNFNPKGT